MGSKGVLLWSLAVLAGAMVLAGLAEAGAFDSMMVPGLIHRIQKRDNVFHPDMPEEEIFSKFFPDSSYLLEPKEQYKDISQSEEDVEQGESMARGLVEDDVSYEEYNSSEEDEDNSDSEVTGRNSLTDGAFKFLKGVGKIGWSMLKKGINFLKSMFYKFGGKRLLKRAKDYLKNDLFKIDPLSCEDGECATCAVLTLPFKIKEFKACAKLGVERKDRQTNFTVKFDVHKHVLFEEHFPVGDIANCFGYDQDPIGEEYGIASMIGKVCVQGFEFKVDRKEPPKKETAPAKRDFSSALKKLQVKKFCLALVFKRWATGYRFCAQRVKPKEKKDNGDDEKEKRAVTPVKKNPDKMSSSKIASDKKNKKWKFTLKRILAGEQENQIVSDQPLFKGEQETRKNNSENALKVIAAYENSQTA